MRMKVKHFSMAKNKSRWGKETLCLSYMYEHKKK